MGDAKYQTGAIPAQRLLVERGITDYASGKIAAETHFKQFLNDMMPLANGSITAFSMGLLAMVTRAQAFHTGAISMLDANNPFATNALIRAYAENAAALLWAADKSHGAASLSIGAERHQRLVVGRIVDSAGKRLPGFKKLYESLSEYTHPVADAFPGAWLPSEDDDGCVQWSSAPRYRSDDGKLWALLWLMELTDVHQEVWPFLYQNSRPNPQTGA